MLLSLLFLCLMFHKSQLSTTVRKPIDLVIKPPPLPFRRQDFSEPKRSDIYNPNYGYEPYWPDGGWVFDRLETTTERRNGTVCGNECTEMYKGFGVICGRDKDFNLKTFENYCELLDEDCEGRKKWLIVYRGACVSGFKLYPTKQSALFTRASDYEYAFESMNPTKYPTGTTTDSTTTA